MEAMDAGARRVLPAIRAAAKQLVPPYRPASRAGLMSAAHSGKFTRSDFIKTGFAAAGPEHE
jgi:hypothetical protein